jgi:hypothetical protein
MLVFQRTIILTGISNRIEYLIDGPPMTQVSACEGDAASGEVCYYCYYYCNDL